MNYVSQALAIGEIMQREPLKSANAKLVVDQSGVGVGAVDLMEANGLRPIRLRITACADETQEGRIHRVAKTILISRLEAAMHAKELHVAAALSEAKSLREELKDFQRHVTASGANTWSARAGKHDDIVLATSLWHLVGDIGSADDSVGVGGLVGSRLLTRSVYFNKQPNEGCPDAQ